ncbi:MAG: 4'-phosphopantetheinyl transferase superfamily protein [Polyangiaceae bacterium]
MAGALFGRLAPDEIAAEALPPGEVHVWYAFTDELEQPEITEACERLLNDEERARHQRLLIDRVRHEHLVTRALARTSLSRYAPVAPEDWVFVKNEWGRPEVQAPAEARWLRFNLSNTRGLVAIAVTRDLEVGVDVEFVERRTEPLAIADRFFSESEVRALHGQVGEEAQRERFFAYWTLKEAYIKARGMGLAIPLGQFSFHLDESGPERITFGPEIEDDPQRWHFWRHRPSATHRVAVAVPDVRARVRVRRAG